ncbi:MAG: GAF domain-containing protein [Anaerolineae bacterium]|nr:GAF domain-containing protein [Anaerolineae bacterium]
MSIELDDISTKEIADLPKELSDSGADNPSRQHSILVVDDNPTNLAVVSNYLKGSGYRILIARNGPSAIQKAQYVQPDLILLDVMMPGIDGFETCHQLKANEKTREIPVIFMTALTEARDKVKGFAVGAVDYVTKPLQHEEVLARVAIHLNIRDMARNLKQQNHHLKAVMAELKEANDTLFKRNLQLETSAALGKQLTSILDLDDLLTKVVELIQSRFNYSFVGIWLFDNKGQVSILQARAGAKSMETLPDSGLKIPVDREDSVIAWVYQQGEQYLVEDVNASALNYELSLVPNAKAELALPLRVKSEVLGVLDIICYKSGFLHEDDQLVLQTLADQIAIAIRNAQLYKAEMRRREFAESLEQVGRTLTSDLNLQNVPQRVLDELSSVVPYERGSVFLRWGDELQSIAKRGYPAGLTTSDLHVLIDSEGVFQRMMSTAQPILVDDVTQDPGWQQMEGLPINHSWLGMPLIAKGSVIGMLSLTRRDVGAFVEDEVATVQAFAGQAAIAIDNAGLFDEITQFNEQLEQQVTQRTEELHKAYQILERLDKTKTDFINVTSHELRTPLSVVKGYSQILKIMPLVEDNPEITKLLNGIIQGVDRLHQIVDTMLDVVRIDTQVLQIRREPTSLLVILEKARLMLEQSLKERRLTLTLTGLQTLPLIEANPDLLVKVFYNLLVNAIKYTPDGGRITITGRTIEVEDEPPAVEILVSDTGIGIAPEHHEQIFEKFYQTGEVAFHSSGKTKFKGGGPGLGLAIVRGIIEAHRGKVWVESEGYDEDTTPGSHFHVRLPVKFPL